MTFYPVQEGDGAEAGVGGGAGARAAEAGLDGAEQDAQDGAGQFGVMGRVGAQALGQGEDPLAEGTGGSTASVRWAATSTMRRAPQKGQANRTQAPQVFRVRSASDPQPYEELAQNRRAVKH